MSQNTLMLCLCTHRAILQSLLHSWHCNIRQSKSIDESLWRTDATAVSSLWRHSGQWQKDLVNRRFFNLRRKEYNTSQASAVAHCSVIYFFTVWPICTKLSGNIGTSIKNTFITLKMHSCQKSKWRTSLSSISEIVCHFFTIWLINAKFSRDIATLIQNT